MTGKLDGKVAIVTGASRGIGAAIAARLAGEGAAVVVNYARSEKEAMELVATIRSGGGRAAAIQASLGDPAAVTGLFERAFATYGRLDVLVNNAGIMGRRDLNQIDPAFCAEIWDVNVRGVLLATQEAARRIGPEGGRVINISSGLARRMRGGTSVYSASKAAVEALTRCHAAELGPRGIIVNAVAPGLVATDMARDIIADLHFQAMLKTSALGRAGAPEDIAGVVAFLASEDARWMTGQVIDVNGGMP